MGDNKHESGNAAPKRNEKANCANPIPSWAQAMKCDGQSDDKDHSAKEEWHWTVQNRAQGAIAVVAFLALTAAVASACFSFGAFKEAQQANVINRKNLIEANRAWIAPDFMTFNRPIEASGGLLDIALKVQNVGRNPAIKAKHNFRIISVPYIENIATGQNTPIPPNNTCDGIRNNIVDGLVFYPSTSNAWIPHNFENSVDYIEAAIERKSSILIQGCISYVSFRERRFSKFTFLLRDKPDCVLMGTVLKRPDCWGFNLLETGSEAD